jgi:hypothetical protein
VQQLDVIVGGRGKAQLAERHAEKGLDAETRRPGTIDLR